MYQTAPLNWTLFIHGTKQLSMFNLSQTRFLMIARFSTVQPVLHLLELQTQTQLDVYLETN